MKKVWIYPSTTRLQGNTLSGVEAVLKEFVSKWAAHGKKLTAGYKLPYDHFIVLWADESYEMPSGCSIDESVGIIRKLEKDFNLTLFNRDKIFYKSGEEIKHAPFQEVDRLYEEGELTDETPVFNPLTATLEDLDTNWLIPFKMSGYFNFVKQPS